MQFAPVMIFCWRGKFPLLWGKDIQQQVQNGSFRQSPLKRAVTHSERFFRFVVISPVLMAVNGAQRFLAVLLLRSVIMIRVTVQS
ncbi:hypothetical protein D8P01_23075 [Salmonella enterica]|nr:hypothetical protein [Salmonella enterica]EAU9595860.1 hypothetical protein [Salmonella enterica]